ncbi:MAG TPA: ethanolamine ammonia-lyase subunit EutC [Rhodocyclaceae bacterium]|nr:ethanolamine ammonia-lyase subunit EutC [Rhodocyclaceae bacterium]
MAQLIPLDTWSHLRNFTRARVALGRTGASLPTREVLAFGLAHAQARDAVHLPLDTAALATELAGMGFQCLQAASAAPDRAAYLRRPDWGRKLSKACRETLAAFAPRTEAERPDCVVVIADGLSSLAAHHALPLLTALGEHLRDAAAMPVVVASQARVALGDEIGHLLGARQVVVLIGERPGLSSPDSLGIYLTHNPQPGLTDADRNCISNVRPEGLEYEPAARKLAYLMEGARRLGKSGVDLKDDSDVASLDGSVTAIDA